MIMFYEERMRVSVVLIVSPRKSVHNCIYVYRLCMCMSMCMCVCVCLCADMRACVYVCMTVCVRVCVFFYLNNSLLQLSI